MFLFAFLSQFSRLVVLAKVSLFGVMVVPLVVVTIPDFSFKLRGLQVPLLCLHLPCRVAYLSVPHPTGKGRPNWELVLPPGGAFLFQEVAFLRGRVLITWRGTVTLGVKN